MSLAIALMLLVAGVREPAVAAQTLAQLVLPTAAPAGAPNGIVQQGRYLTAPVALDGVTLIRIAAPLDAPVGQLPIAARAINVQAALDALVAETGTGPRADTVFDPKTIRVHVRRIGDLTVLEAVDGKHTDPLPIVTVTSIDAGANAVSVQTLAVQWQETLQVALVRALQLRQPAAETRGVFNVVRLAIVMVAASLIIYAIVRACWRAMGALEADMKTRVTTATDPSAVAPEVAGAGQRRRRFFALQLRTLEPAARIGWIGATAEALLWALGLCWFIAVTWSLSLFAETTPLSQSIAHGAFGITATVIVAGLINRILDAVIARGATAWRLTRFTNSEDRARLLLRIPTIARAFAGGKTFVLVFVAVLSMLGQVGVPIGSVVTIGGLAAIALSLAAQNFVRDFLNGFLVLFEDQYVVGDFVTINTYSGLVERLTLRMVQIRDGAGDLITIPHSSVINVVNQSRNWSRVDYRVPVDPGADILKAMDIVRAQIMALSRADDWMHERSEPIEWIGIDALSKDWIVIRASIKTAPLRQFELRRQINERVRTAFAAGGIALGAQLPVV